MNKWKPRVTIITPTIDRDPKTIKRALYSVRGQMFTEWKHIVCSDGKFEQDVHQMMTNDEHPQQHYMSTDSNLGHYGAGVRQYVLENHVFSEYVCFLDDDNVLLPHYLETMVEALDQNPQHDFAISRTLHFGPLPTHLGFPPKIIYGTPPNTQNIDTIQVMVRTEVMKKCGWKLDGYLSDGRTYEAMSKDHSYVVVPELLSIHF